MAIEIDVADQATASTILHESRLPHTGHMYHKISYYVNATTSITSDP